MADPPIESDVRSSGFTYVLPKKSLLPSVLLYPSLLRYGDH